MSDHFSGPGRSRVRPATSLISMRSPALSARAILCSCWTCCQSAPRLALLRGDRLPLPAAASHHIGRRGSRSLPLRRRGPGDRSSAATSRLRGKAEPAVAPVQEGWCVTPSGETTRFRVHDEQGAGQRWPARLRRPQSGTILHRRAGPHRVAKDRATCLQGGRDQ